MKFKPELLELEDRTVPSALVVDGRTPVVIVAPAGQLQQVWTGTYTGESPVPLVTRVVVGDRQVVAWTSSPDGFRVINVAIADFAGELIVQHVLPDAPSVVLGGQSLGGPPLFWALEIQAVTDAEEPIGPAEITVIWVADGIHQQLLGNVQFTASSIDGGTTFGPTGVYVESADDDEEPVQQQKQKQPPKKKLGKHANQVGKFFARHR
jgi:hypothetical protein